MNLNRLTRRLARRAPRCEHEITTWGPHDGCREFMDEPEVHFCGEVATRQVSFFTSYGGHAITRYHFCTEHGTEAAVEAATTPYIDAVRVQPIGGRR